MLLTDVSAATTALVEWMWWVNGVLAGQEERCSCSPIHPLFGSSTTNNGSQWVYGYRFSGAANPIAAPARSSFVDGSPEQPVALFPEANETFSYAWSPGEWLNDSTLNPIAIVAEDVVFGGSLLRILQRGAFRPATWK
ncbi:MAG: hypothetical protein R2795_23145 [Saprospiraceae bacterium]